MFYQVVSPTVALAISTASRDYHESRGSVRCLTVGPPGLVLAIQMRTRQLRVGRLAGACVGDSLIDAQNRRVVHVCIAGLNASTYAPRLLALAARVSGFASFRWIEPVGCCDGGLGVDRGRSERSCMGRADQWGSLICHRRHDASAYAKTSASAGELIQDSFGI